MDLGPPELIIILVLILVLFGGAKLPQLARSLGQAKREFEGATKGEKSADEKATAAPAPAAPAIEAQAAPAPAPAAEPAPAPSEQAKPDASA